MLPTKPIHFIGGAMLLLAILMMLAGNIQLGLVFVVLGLGMIFSRLLVKDKPKGPGDAG